MDLNLTEAQQTFRNEVRAWLRDNAPPEPLPPSHTEAGFRAHRAGERGLHAAGLAAIHWPLAYGGRDADMVDVAIFQEEYARAGVPERINVLALGLVGPTIIVHGTEEQKRRWLPDMLSCDAIWCQGFSEPDAGSDLANVKTTAVRDGNAYVVNGQKTWTSLGRFADWMFALVRTRAGADPRHAGLTTVVIDMRADGVEVRPIVQLNGDPGFAEVFFTDVRVPVANVLGEEHGGWQVAMTTLGFERGTGLGTHVRFSRNVADLVALARATRLDRDPRVRDEIARRYVETEVYRHHMYRTLTRLDRQGEPGPEASLTKLYWSQMEARIFETGMAVLGPLAELTANASVVDDALGGAAAVWEQWQRHYWYARASTIYAGTSEIQKNIIAERVLGLPKEPRTAGDA
jgi:alkylation response protein AidB-like acyl-CoA dehydrogenase